MQWQSSVICSCVCTDLSCSVITYSEIKTATDSLFFHLYCEALFVIYILLWQLVCTGLREPVWGHVPVSEMWACLYFVWTFHANLNCVLSVTAQLVWIHWLASVCESGTTLWAQCMKVALPHQSIAWIMYGRRRWKPCSASSAGCSAN